MIEFPPYGLGPGSTVFLALVILVAAFVRGFSGFGFSALLVAGGGLVTSPVNMVPLAMVLEITATAGQAAKAWPKVNWRKAGLLLAGAALGSPLGIWLLIHLDGDVLRAIIAVFVFTMSILLLTGLRFRQPLNVPGTIGAGVVSGIANGAAVGGLPVGLMMSAEAMEPARFRATMIAYLAVLDVMALSIMAWHAVLNWQTLNGALLALPLLIAGVTLGGRHFISASPASFRRFVLGLLMVLSVIGLARSFVFG